MSPETRTQAILGSAIMLRHQLRQEVGEITVAQRYAKAVACAQQHGLNIPKGSSLEEPDPVVLEIIEQFQALATAA